MTDQLLNYLRDLMVLAADATNVPLLSVSETNGPALHRQAQTWGLNTIVAALQIISEAKLKMQRATFGRALVELALIRLTLLEQLQSLDALLTELASSPTNRTLPTASVPTVELEKKKPEPVVVPRVDSAPFEDSSNRTHEQQRSVQNGIESQTSDAPPSASAFRLPAETSLPTEEEQAASVASTTDRIETSAEPISTPSTPVSAQSSSDFQPGSESAFWAQVLSEIGDDVGSALRKAGRVAIRGPNRLEVEFPKSYLFAKSLAEQPEARQKLDSVVAKLAGRPVQVVFSVSDEPVSNGESAPVPKPVRRMDTSTNGDPYVEKAIELFNAKIMKKEALARPSSQET